MRQRKRQEEGGNIQQQQQSQPTALKDSIKKEGGEIKRETERGEKEVRGETEKKRWGMTGE